jgi:hypothetical protein
MAFAIIWFTLCYNNHRCGTSRLISLAYCFSHEAVHGLLVYGSLLKSAYDRSRQLAVEGADGYSSFQECPVSLWPLTATPGSWEQYSGIVDTIEYVSMV